jgi:hypothetical protein
MLKTNKNLFIEIIGKWNRKESNWYYKTTKWVQGP